MKKIFISIIFFILFLNNTFADTTISTTWCGYKDNFSYYQGDLTKSELSFFFCAGYNDKRLGISIAKGDGTSLLNTETNYTIYGTNVKSSGIQVIDLNANSLVVLFTNYSSASYTAYTSYFNQRGYIINKFTGALTLMYNSNYQYSFGWGPATTWTFDENYIYIRYNTCSTYSNCTTMNPVRVNKADSTYSLTATTNWNNQIGMTGYNGKFVNDSKTIFYNNYPNFVRKSSTGSGGLIIEDYSNINTNTSIARNITYNAENIYKSEPFITKKLDESVFLNKYISDIKSGYIYGIPETLSGSIINSSYSKEYVGIYTNSGSNTVFNYLNLSGNIINYSNSINNDYIQMPIEITNNGTLISIDSGLRIEGVALSKRFKVDSIHIFKYELGTSMLIEDKIKQVNWSGTGQTIYNFDILSDENFIINPLLDYEVEVIYKDYSNIDPPVTKIYTIGQYNYNNGYIDPENITFKFVTSGFNFFENGFELINFIPDPSGGELYFEIIAPNPNGTGTINEETKHFLPYEIDGSGYGFDSKVNVTYPYHRKAGTYQVRTVYKFQEFIIYPFGEDYNSYVITLAELPGDITTDLDNLYNICDINQDGFVDLLNEGFKCIFTIANKGINSGYQTVNGLLQLVKEIMKIGQTEYNPITFFIPETFAETPFDNMTMPSDDNVLMKVYNMVYYAIIIMLVLFILSFLIFKKK